MTPGKYPKEHIQYLKHGKIFKSRILPPDDGLLIRPKYVEGVIAQ
jgi:hypothetical protein